MHVLEIPATEEGQTIMTVSEGEEEELDEVEEDITDEKDLKERATTKRKAALKNGNHNGNGIKNGKNGVEEHETNGKEEIEVEGDA